MQADISQISSLVLDLLKDSPPEIAARLKQRLNASLTKNGFDRFDEKSFGSKRFKDFLHKHFSEVLTLTPPIGPGDILVSLKNSLPIDANTANPAPQKITNVLEKPVVRSDVWQAFLNQDHERLRYLSKRDGRVLHHRNGEPAAVKAAIDGDPTNYEKITPISEDTQLAWFKEFLEKNPPKPPLGEAIEKLIQADVGSAMIASISRMLGSDGDAWRAQRVRCIYAHIADWCAERNFDPAIISSRPQLPHVEAAAPSVTAVSTSVRKQAYAILDSLSDNDIAQIVLPILVSTILVKART